MRQKEDKVFAEALNNLAIGECTSNDIKLFESRHISSMMTEPPVEAIRLFRTNDEVNAYISALNNMPAIGEISVADDEANGDVTAEVKQYALKLVSNMPTQKTYGLPSTITLKEGA